MYVNFTLIRTHFKGMYRAYMTMKFKYCSDKKFKLWHIFNEIMGIAFTVYSQGHTENSHFLNGITLKYNQLLQLTLSSQNK